MKQEKLNSQPSVGLQQQPEYQSLQQQQVHYINSKNPKSLESSITSSKILQSQQIFIDQQFEQVKVKIKTLLTEKQGYTKIQTHYYVIEVYSQFRQRIWEIERRYSDFQWLYHALTFSYPGCILPYFPQKSIQSYMVTKLGIQYGEESKQQHLNMRKDELQQFLNRICIHPILKQAQQTKIFLKQQKQQFLKLQKDIELQIQQSQAQQSSSNGIVSLFERSVAWIANSGLSKEKYKIDNVDGWENLEKEIKLWIKQYTELINKIQRLKQIKNFQSEWQGPQTDIDSVQQLKARVISSQQYNKIFEQELQQNISKNIEYEAKCLRQLQCQLEQRQNIISIINYIYKFNVNSSSNNRCNKLLRKKQKFEINMTREWPIYKDELRLKIRAVQKKFNEVWLKYCRKVQKIWKQK